MKSFTKIIASKLSLRHQQELKRLHFGRLIRREKFDTEEQEYSFLDEWVADGDWVLDVGANVGVYSKKLSALVGRNGRVLAIEPVPETFELLAANAARFTLKNISLLNVAASDKFGLAGIHMPKFDSGLDNYYMAHLTEADTGYSVLTLPIDSLDILNSVKLIKIDVEGHEFSALKGMESLLKRDHPRLIVEGVSEQVSSFLRELGYSYEQLEGSPNRIFTCA